MPRVTQENAEAIVAELHYHAAGGLADSQYLIDRLVSTELPDTDNFYLPIPPGIIPISRDMPMRVEGVLDNRRVMDSSDSGLRTFTLADLTRAAPHDPNIIAREMQRDKEITAILQACQYPFSALCLVENFKPSSFLGSTAPLRSRPAILVPGNNHDGRAPLTRLERRFERPLRNV